MSIIKLIYRKTLLKLFQSFGFYTNCNCPKSLLGFILQKVIGFNRGAPFPTHFTSVVHHKNIQFGNDTCPGLAPGNYIQDKNGIILGDSVWIGPNVSIISANHDYKNLEKHLKGKPIKIGNNCWIGANSVILPEVELGNNVIVGAGAIVTKSFKDNNIIIAGNPAKIIKKI